ncbi:MAG: hypothetical protein AB7V18_19565 [Pyrinomonadaceae bacterium]
MNQYLDLLPMIRLSFGFHAAPEDGMCVMEAVAYVSGEMHSDTPQCVCGSFIGVARAINDKMTPSQRDKYLTPLVFEFPGTKLPENGLDFQKKMEIWQRRAQFQSDICDILAMTDNRHSGLSKYYGWRKTIPVFHDRECEKIVDLLRRSIALYRAAPVEYARDPRTLPCLEKGVSRG